MIDDSTSSTTGEHVDKQQSALLLTLPLSLTPVSPARQPRGFVGLMTESSFFNDALVDFLTVPDVFGCRVSRDLNHVVLTGW